MECVICSNNGTRNMDGVLICENCYDKLDRCSLCGAKFLPDESMFHCNVCSFIKENDAINNCCSICSEELTDNVEIEEIFFNGNEIVVNLRKLLYCPNCNEIMKILKGEVYYDIDCDELEWS